MALPFVFANVTELDTPQLDANFNALGALSTIPCTASGTNAITLTPVANAPTIAAYSNEAPVFGFKAAATNTTAVTLQVGGLSFLNVYKANGQALLAANDFVIGGIYYVGYDLSLNSGAGGWVVLNPGASAATAGAVQSAFRNLVITNTTAGTPNTQCIVTAGSVAVSDGASNFTTLINPNVTISSAASGANGLDTGTLAASTWYAIWLIYNPSTLTVAGLMSLSFTAPTAPAGFSQGARLAAMRTDGSKNFLRVLQKGRRAQYVVTAATNTAAMPQIATGTAGSIAVPTWVSESVASVVPPTASKINMVLQSGAATASMAAPNNGYGANTSASNPPPVTSASGNDCRDFDFVLESAAVFYASASASASLWAIGWEDNI